MTVSALRKIEFTSSWLQGGFWLLAAILKGRRKQLTISCSCSRYSSSASTIRKTRLQKKRKLLAKIINNKNKKYYLFRFRIFSACGELMYSLTILFHRRLQSQPRKKDCTFLIFWMSSDSSSSSSPPDAFGSPSLPSSSFRPPPMFPFASRAALFAFGVSRHSRLRVQS